MAPRFRLAATLAAALLAASCAGRGAPAIPPPVAAQLAALAADPALVPPEPPPGRTIVMLTVSLSGDRVVPDGAPIPLPISRLRLERALEMRRGTQPAYWAIQTEPGGAVTYWSSVDPTPVVRLRVRDAQGHGHGRRAALTVPAMFVALRVPFTANGRIDFVTPGGASYGGYRFGARPDAPVVPAGPS